MRIVVTGASGLIGQALVSTLTADGHDTLVLVRRSPRPGEGQWDPSRGQIDPGPLEGTDAVVHLAGAGIGDRRWTAARRDVIVRSRVESTTLLSRTLATLAHPPPVLVSASAVGYYGDRGDEELTEAAAPGTGFLAEVCRAWEAATSAAEQAGIRVVHLRSAVVLSSAGGALRRQLPLFRAGLGGRLGSGEQWWSWISLADEVGVIRYVIGESTLVGAVNASAPAPVTNAAFTRELGHAVHRPAVLAVPSFALRLALGRGLTDELLLGGQRVVPAKLSAGGYRFRHPGLAVALAELIE